MPPRTCEIAILFREIRARGDRQNMFCPQNRTAAFLEDCVRERSTDPADVLLGKQRVRGKINASGGAEICIGKVLTAVPVGRHLMHRVKDGPCLDSLIIEEIYDF